MVVEQCLRCKNSNPQCRQSFILYFCALNTATQMVNDGNKDSKFFPKEEQKREYDFEIKCSHYEEKEKKEEE